jgi:hypothetical protein
MIPDEQSARHRGRWNEEILEDERDPEEPDRSQPHVGRNEYEKALSMLLGFLLHLVRHALSIPFCS